MGRRTALLHYGRMGATGAMRDLPKGPPVDIVVFWEEGFPCIDTRSVTQDALHAASVPGQSVRFVSADELPAALDAQPDLFVNPYGSAFPKSVWPAFTAYLRRGGNWVNLGGAPVSRPVRRNEVASLPEIGKSGNREKAEGSSVSQS